MNITIYCSSASITATPDESVQLYVKDIDMDMVLKTVTSRFTLKQILDEFDDEHIVEVINERNS